MLQPLAEAVAKAPGWRLELVVIEASPSEVHPLGEHQIRRRLDEALRLLDVSQVGAFLVGWTAIEALIRRMLPGDEALKTMTPIKMIKNATSYGLISQSSGDVLLNAAQLRNSLIHGLTADESLLTPKTVAAFLREAVELLERPEVEPDQNTVDAVTADEMVDWFFANYADPSEGVPYETAEGGYVYFLGGPYDAEEVLTDRFPDVPEATLDEAVRQILRSGSEWVKKGQYPSNDRRRLAD